MKPANPRVRAIQILVDVIYYDQSLQECFILEDTPFIYQLAYGTLRFYYSLRVMANYALTQKLSDKDRDIYLLIILGIYQIQYLENTPEYAIVSETVDTVVGLKKPWAKKLVNAILRRFLRERDAFEAQCKLSDSAQYAHPQWFVDRVKSSWPEQWKEILIANNQKAPMHLRVNKLKNTREAYLELLSQDHTIRDKIENKSNEKIIAHIIPETTEGLCLEKPVDVYQLPGFIEGFISVQDAASQRVIKHLDLHPALRVLDACAAPGGKTCHILETEPHLQSLISIDISQERIDKIKENLGRLKLNDPSKVKLLCGDAATPETWWDNKLFDRILLDAPCSATGVIRRHPDIKLIRTLKDVLQAVQKQTQILESLWPLLKPHGLLVYTTCSVLPEENEAQIAQFIKKHADAKLNFIQQVLPSKLNDSDGFFYAVLQKNI